MVKKAKKAGLADLTLSADNVATAPTPAPVPGAAEGKAEPEYDLEPSVMAQVSITVAELLRRDDLPDAVREWLERVVSGEFENPPQWVGDEGCWEKAKRAAGHANADDMYAFATWWYIEHAGCPMK